MITLRASKAPLAFRCAGSLQPPTVAIEETTEPARLGTATHEALRPLAEGGSIAWDELPDMAERHEVDGDEIRMLCAMAARLWPQLREAFPHAATEVDMRAVVGDRLTLTGHADVLSTVLTNGGDCGAHGGDWKTGRKDSDYSQQMRAYCALALLRDASLVSATWSLIWLRSGEVETYTMRRDELVPWLDQTELALWNWDGVYRPGEWCSWCSRAHECEARTAMVRRDISAFLETTVMADAMVPAAMISMARRARIVKKAADAVLALIKAHVDANGEVAGDGVTLAITETPTRKLDVGKAWPVLEQMGFGDADFVSTLTMSIGKVEKRVAERAGKGNGAAAVRALATALEDAGAITLDTKRSLEEIRK